MYTYYNTWVCVYIYIYIHSYVYIHIYIYIEVTMLECNTSEPSSIRDLATTWRLAAGGRKAIPNPLK